MTMDRSSRADSVLAGLMDELADTRTPAYLEAAIERASSRPQRPAWTFPERWLPMSTITSRLAAPPIRWRTIGLVALLIAALAAGAIFVVGSQRPALPEPFGLAKNGMVAYQSDGDLYLADPVSGAARLVLAGPEEDVYPIWSHDGTRLAFIRKSGTTDQYPNGQMFVADKDGGHAIPITPDPVTAITWFQFSPDDRSIVIASAGSAVNASMSSVIIAATDGTGVRSLDLPGLPDGFEALSPGFRPSDGSEILLTGYGDTRGGIYVVGADGSNFRAVVEPAGDGVHFNEATWSPDGSQIAYTREDGGLWQVHVLTLDGLVDHTLHATGAVSEGWPVWSPDGSHVVFQRIMSDGTDVYAIVPVDESRPGVEVHAGFGPNGAAYAWSPDGKSILAMPNDNPTRQQLWDPVTGASTPAPWTAASVPAWQRVAP